MRVNLARDNLTAALTRYCNDDAIGGSDSDSDSMSASHCTETRAAKLVLRASELRCTAALLQAHFTRMPHYENIAKALHVPLV